MKVITVAIAVLCAPILVLTEDALVDDHVESHECVPGDVENLQVIPSATSAVVTWSKLEQLCPGGKTEIVISWTSEKSGTKTVAATEERFEVQGLKPWTEVIFHVHLLYTSDDGKTQRGPESKAPITTKVDKPSPPRDIKILSIRPEENGEGTEMIVQWEVPETANGPIDGYMYTVCSSPEPCNKSNEFQKCHDLKETLNKTWQSVRRLVPLKNYQFSVVAYNKNGEGGKIKSDPAKVCERASSPIKELEGVRVECTGNPKKVSMSWKEPAESEHWERYEVTVSTEKGGQTDIIATLALNNTLACKGGRCSVEVTRGLKEDTEYRITVKPFMKKLAQFIEEYSVSKCKTSKGKGKGSGQEGLQGFSALILLALLVVSLVKVR